MPGEKSALDTTFSKNCQAKPKITLLIIVIFAFSVIVTVDNFIDLNSDIVFVKTRELKNSPFLLFAEFAICSNFDIIVNQSHPDQLKANCLQIYKNNLKKTQLLHKIKCTTESHCILIILRTIRFHKSRIEVQYLVGL